MMLSAEGLRLIAAFEGFSARPYRCPAGYWTIGYGHLCGSGDHPPASETQARHWLKADAAVAERAVRRMITAPLTQGRYDALVSFTFNLGSGALERSSLRASVNRGDHEEAVRQFMRWVWAGGRKMPGLLRRRAAEAVMYAG